MKCRNKDKNNLEKNNNKYNKRKRKIIFTKMIGHFNTKKNNKHNHNCKRCSSYKKNWVVIRHNNNNNLKNN
jgi:hypothetical protein